ncbi:MAG: peptidylprolyl isomerase [Gammaproteobacteria bacterium]|jgi:FKBP-type peptidyl-prolyl cis-trans isomerase SlyD|nr:peptidylprolyl isomerase [Gammaproteobacteria bacterium]
MNISDNCVVSIHYTLTDDDGRELDSSAGQSAFSYLHGARNIIPGLEQALTGKAPGDEMRVTVQPKDAYGEINPELVQQVPREAFAGIDDLQPGMQFRTGDDEQSLNVTVTEVNEDSVTIDANHPLAGLVLHFDVRIEAVREAGEEELAHGHVHS